MDNEREVYNIGTSPIVCMNCKEGHSNESTLLHQNKYSNRNPSSASSLYSNSTTHSMAPSSNWKKSFLFKNVRGSSLADDDLNETNDFNDYLYMVTLTFRKYLEMKKKYFEVFMYLHFRLREPLSEISGYRLRVKDVLTKIKVYRKNIKDISVLIKSIYIFSIQLTINEYKYLNHFWTI